MNVAKFKSKKFFKTDFKSPFFKKIFFAATLIFFATELNFCSADVRLGDRGDEVREVQVCLIAQGLLGGKPDGVCGEQTVEAIKNFQSAIGFEVTGICDEKTFKVLHAAAYGKIDINEFIAGKISFDGIDRAESNNLESSDAPLKLGDNNDRVREMQDMLIGLGYLTGTADGIFGQGTETALKKFQAANGLTADGICGAATFQALNNPDLRNTETVPASGEYAEIGSVIKPGMQGPGVKAVQERLIERGYLSGSADGICGEGTVNAIRDFQRSMGLTADGVCGIMTYAALENEEYEATDEEEEEWEDAVDSMPTYSRSIYVRATAYSADDSGLSRYTASGTRVRRGVIAVDPSVIPLGTRVYIPGYGEAIAEDTGGSVVGNTIDIAFDTYEEAMSFGVQSFEIYILDD